MNKKYEFDVMLDGKIKIQVMAESSEQAKNMVDDLLQNSNFLDLTINKEKYNMKVRRNTLTPRVEHSINRSVER